MNGTVAEVGTVRTVVVMRDRMLREALVESLASRDEIEVCEHSGNFEPDALLQLIERDQPDVVLLDFEGRSELGLRCLQALSRFSHDARILITGLPETDRVILAAIESGAAGIATRRTSLAEVIDNIHAVSSGKTICSPQVAGMLFSQIAQSSDASSAEERERLTPREREIVALVERGLTNKAIANELCIGVQTVKNHVHNILEKLDMHRRTEVARYARRVGWAVPGTGTQSPAARAHFKG